jgi:hypothetical protein
VSSPDPPLDRAIRRALGDIVAAAPRRDDVPVGTGPVHPARNRGLWLVLAAGLTAAAGIVAVVLVTARVTITTDVSPTSLPAASTTLATATSTTLATATSTTTSLPATTEAPTVAPTVAPTPGPLQRVEFRRGTNNTSVAGDLAAGTVDRYVLEAAADQTMIVHVDGGDGIAFSIVAPDGTTLADDEVLAAVTLPADGDYVVEIGTTGARGAYTVDFLIN